MAAESLFAVEVAFATPMRQHLVVVEVTPQTTAREAVALANLPALFPEQPEETFSQAPLGIFGKALREPQRQTLSPGDRIEVYRPLKIDPKAARLARAKRQASR
ncbi:RnfH family protein [Halomonas sp. HNIBRBA4712]|uniref:RnfH family protein n=1 Tax=Halomonas sp. HNIBRBA4712 TaxID=3373087 RepID=UPI003745DAD6